MATPETAPEPTVVLTVKLFQNLRSSSCSTCISTTSACYPLRSIVDIGLPNVNIVLGADTE